MTPDSYVFGVTLDQVDELGRLIRTIAAHGDMIAIGGANPMDKQSLPTLGDLIYDAARAVRSTLDQVGEQRLEKAAAAATPAGPEAGRPAFAGDMHSSLLQARSIMQVMSSAADQADGAEGMAGCCRAVFDLLGSVIEYVEANFGAFSKRP